MTKAASAGVSWTALTLGLTAALALLLAPGEARAANECVGAISSTNPSRTCTATTYADGIIYQNVNPGATGVATVIVPGASTAWTVTSGAGTSFASNGITLDSDEPANAADAGGGLALTVGGTSASANQVAISQRSGNTNTAEVDYNNGIFINQQRRGAAATTVTVNSGVTIGASGARMNNQGIRANIWLGTGAATFTNHGEIHSTREGIDLNRGDSADTNAATTITNSGAITAGLRGILLNYFAGDTTGGGGNTDSTTAGGAKITNSGTITMHAAVAADSGAIELSYERGHGNAEVDNRGNIIANAAGTTGYGIYLEYGGTNGGGTGTAMITNSGTITSKQAAIYLNNNGKGASTITNNGGALTVENTSGDSRFGIYLYDRGATTAATTKVATVTNSGDITSTNLGINVNVHGKNTAEDDVGVSITHSAGAIVVSAGGGIKGNIGGESGSVATANTGDINIMVTGGSVRSSGTILEASHSQAGDVMFDVSEGVMLTSTAQHGIFANVPSANTVGDITVTNAGTITTPKTGLFVRRSAPTGTGKITVTNHGDIKKTGDTDWDGILVEDLGRGDIEVTNSGNIGTADAMHERGIRVQKQAGAAEGDVTVTTTGGSIFGKEYGIRVTDTGDHTGAITISNGGDITSVRPINVNRNGAGDVTVTNTGGTVLSDTFSAVSVRNKSGDASDVRVDVSGGTLRSPGNAIQAFNRGTGDVLHTFGADATLISESGDAVYTTLFSALAPDNQIKIAQGGAIMGRTGLYARVGGNSVFDDAPEYEVAKRADGKSDVIDVTWTGSFSHGVTDEEKAIVSQSDAGRFSGSFAGVMLFSMQTLEGEDATGGVYGGAAGVEAQVISRREAITEVAKGDDLGAFADNAAQMAAVPTGATAADNDYVAQFRAVLGDERFDIQPSVFEAIKTGAMSLAELTDADIVTYLQTDDANTRTLLRNILAMGFSDEEKDVLKALAEGADKDALEAVLTAAGFTDDPANDEDYWSKVTGLLDRYNPGNINVAMDGGSIVSRGDGIRAYYATRHENNGAINVTVAAGARITAAKAGIYAANAGSGGVRVENAGMITGSEYGIRVLGPSTMTNGGMSRSSHQAGSGSVRVVNRGMVTGKTGIDVPAASTVVTSGPIVSTGTGMENIAVRFRGTGASTLTVEEGGEIDAIIQFDGTDDEVNLSGAFKGDVEMIRYRNENGDSVTPATYTPATKEKPQDAGEQLPMMEEMEKMDGKPTDMMMTGEVGVKTSVFALTDDVLSDLTGSIHRAVVETETGMRPGPLSAGQVVWATPFGGARDQNGSGKVADATHYFGGGMVGTSWGAKDVRVGGFIGGSMGSLDVKGSQPVDVDMQTIFGGIVASHTIGNVLYDARMLFGHITHDSTRRLTRDTAEVEYTSLLFSPEVGVATTMKVTDTLEALPRLRVRYAGLFTEDFQERGQRTDWNVQVEKQTVHLVEGRAEVGVPFALENGGLIKPRVGVEGRWLLSGSDLRMRATSNASYMSSDPGGDDTVVTGTMGVGVSVPVAEGMTLAGSFDGALTTEEAWRAFGWLGLTYSF